MTSKGENVPKQDWAGQPDGTPAESAPAHAAADSGGAPDVTATNGGKPAGETTAGQKAKADRLAAALRQNLQRRKAQSRGRKTP